MMQLILALCLCACLGLAPRATCAQVHPEPLERDLVLTIAGLLDRGIAAVESNGDPNNSLPYSHELRSWIDMRME